MLCNYQSQNGALIQGKKGGAKWIGYLFTMLSSERIMSQEGDISIHSVIQIEHIENLSYFCSVIEF